MPDLPICSYCSQPCNRRPHYFTVERVEGGRVVSRGHACGVGCLMAVAGVQRDGNGRAVYESHGHLTPVSDGVIGPEEAARHAS